MTATGRTGLSAARAIALIVPAGLLAGAWGFQLIAGLAPCEMCHWQRWPHYAALVIALLAILLRRSFGLSRTLVVLAGLAILVSAGIAVLHAGVEYHWWTGPTRCTANIFAGGGDPLKALLSAPLIRCDTAPWSFAGISLAGFNAILSTLGGLAVVILGVRARR